MTVVGLGHAKELFVMRFTDEILTTQEVAKYIKMNERTVLKLAQENKIPAVKVASQWRFKKALIDDWLDMEMKNFSSNHLDEINQGIQAPVLDVAQLLDPRLVIADMTAVTKEEAIEELVGQVDELDHPPVYLDRILSAVLQREKMFSTGFPGGVAIPHPRNVKEMRLNMSHLVVGRSSQGIEYGSMDGQPTHIFFLLCAHSEKSHLKLLAQLSMFMRDVKNIEILKEAKEHEGLFHALRNMFGADPSSIRAANQ
jgi:excisionase family DNA binding protein